MNELVVRAKTEHLPQVQAFVGERLAGCPAKIRGKISIVVDEIFSNIVHYAYGQSGGDIAVRVDVSGGELILVFEDSGIPYNPLDAEVPDLTLPAANRQVGGLGVFMVKSLMDSVEYQRDGTKNQLTVKKAGVTGK